jgi:hypothetical protein
MPTRLTANTIVFNDGTEQGEYASRIRLADIPITVTLNYQVLDFDAGIDCEVWNSQIARPFLQFSIGAHISGFSALNNARATTNARFGFVLGANTWGHWERTRWSGPHRYLFNFRWRTNAITAVTGTPTVISLYYMNPIGT